MYCMEVNTESPSLAQLSQCVTEQQTRGLALVPKLCLDVMSCELLRLLQLTDRFIIPISFSVPRKVSLAVTLFLCTSNVLHLYCMHCLTCI
ncbi:hypothetical protein AB205_0214270 [Aquarana catesbeiana]|uniref:Uncharacterized protein n=1 Tax=Aquarana catesbeiana TaxID=8400 RepID=A0A2G9Q969_AQUCT|nr:hypothetical protein AB205_0214270 [Aquarana catesbeiana]